MIARRRRLDAYGADIGLYVFGQDTKQAIATSLLVVGITSLVGLWQHARADRVRWRVGLIFGGVAMIGAYAGGRAAAHVASDLLLMVFASLMVVVALLMLRRRRQPVARQSLRLCAWGYRVSRMVTGLVGLGWRDSLLYRRSI
ncbi:MAG: sulfite exporter TauE/SafE family protein [Myxococcota bacterium]